MPTLESSLLYTREDGTQDFVHDRYRDFFLAKWFADRNLDFREFYNLPEWKTVILFYSGIIEDSSNLIRDLIGRDRLFVGTDCLIVSRRCDEEVIRGLIMELANMKVLDYEYWWREPLPEGDNVIPPPDVEARDKALGKIKERYFHLYWEVIKQE